MAWDNYQGVKNNRPSHQKSRRKMKHTQSPLISPEQNRIKELKQNNAELLEALKEAKSILLDRRHLFPEKLNAIDQAIKKAEGK